jgi:outer membrane protein OmpA-like peptidoglycan-associated protein
MRHPLITLLALCALLAGTSHAAGAQGIFGKIKDRAKAQVDRKTDQAVDATVDKAANAIACVISDKECIRKAQAAGKPIKVTDASGHAVSSADSAAAISAAVADAAITADAAIDEGAPGAGTSPAGGKSLYDAIAASGRTTTHGIVFAPGSATIGVESAPTLQQIGEMLQAHPTLELRIEVHTDNAGSAAASQTLSEKRAAALKDYLVATYHIPAARLATAGLGASKPIAPNTTPEGRQANSRVELVKM